MTVRPMNQRHIETLRAAYMSGAKQFKLLAARFVSGDLARAMDSGAAVLQVLGGNHTRAAIQSLYDSGLIDAQVMVTVYRKDLSAPEALAIGVYHNTVDDTSLSMSFMDKAGVIRKIKRSTSTKSWSRSAMLVFGFKSTGEARCKMRTMAALADVDDDVWAEIQICVSKWSEKKPLTQTAYTKFVTLERKEQLELLLIWMNSGYKEYLKELHNSTTTMKRVLSHDSEKQVEKRSLDDDTVDNNQLRNEMKKLKEDNRKKDEIMNNLKRENLELQEDNRKKDEIVNNLQKENLELQTQKYEQNSTIEKLRSEVNKLSKKIIKQRDNTENISPPSQDVGSMYSVGEKVWAYYAPTDEAYPAVVTAIEDSMYIVRYIEDGIEDKVTDEGIWKFQKRKKTH